MMGNFVQDNEREWILEAINHLKHRKARPDLSRISLRMKRKYQINFAQTKKLLESLIESGIVVKAVYKNNTSYRDVSKWKKGRLGGQIQNSSKMLKRFVSAIKAKEIGKGTGVTCKEIEEFLGSQGEEKCFLSGAALLDALENEVSTGYLKKVYTGGLTRYLINEENNDSLNKILEETNRPNSVSDRSVDLNLPSQSHNEAQTISKSVIENDSLEIQTRILISIRETESSQQQGSSLRQINQYLHERYSFVLDEVYLGELLDQYVMNNVIMKKGECYIIPNNVPDTVNKVLGIDQDLGAATSRNLEETDTYDDQQAKILQGLSLIPKSATLKDANFKPSTLNILPGFSPAVPEDNKPASSSGPSRPPSKRKRIMKDHGPDFEIEMPTKSKSKWQDMRDSVYPTPSSSPTSERSECTFDQSLKSAAAKKKRGRPKKLAESKTPKEEASFEDDNSQQSSLLQSSQMFPAGNDIEEDSLSSTPQLDVSAWTVQQVADYFKEKGYTEEAQSMLDHDIDGLALGLLRRSDVVGPPLGGILQVKKLGTALKLFRDIRDLLYQGHANNYVDPYEERPFSRL